MKDEDVYHRLLLPGSVTNSVLKSLQGAAHGYMTYAEIAEATGWGVKAIAWAVFFLRRKGLIKGRRRGAGLEYRAVLAHGDRALKPKPMEAVRMSTETDFSSVGKGQWGGGEQNPMDTPRTRQGSDFSAIPEDRCGARTRAGTPCRLHAMYFSTRCKFHGGLSTGPKTEAGKEQARVNGRKGGRPRKQAANPTP